MKPGDVMRADIGAEQRSLVVVVTPQRVAELIGRALVAPLLDEPEVDVPSPFRVRDTTGRLWGVDLARTVAGERLLEPVGVVDSVALGRITRGALRLVRV